MCMDAIIHQEIEYKRSRSPAKIHVVYHGKSILNMEITLLDKFTLGFFKLILLQDHFIQELNHLLLILSLKSRNNRHFRFWDWFSRDEILFLFRVKIKGYQLIFH